ncbi:MAG: (Fe-S)-binding protein [Nitrospirae bacterium]|nr:MAG: (Fe-S)-binding protein [Nitrospirota bacterium]
METAHSPSPPDLSRCVRCGICKTLCPTYAEEPAEGMGARGRVALVKGLASGQISPSRLLNKHLYSCILCGACSGSCPLGIDVPETVYQGRSLLRDADVRRRVLRYLTRLSVAWPDAAYRLARMAQGTLWSFLARKGIIPEFPELQEVPFRKAEQVFKTHKKKRGRVAVFTGCSINYIFPDLGESLLNVLQKLNYEVVLPKGEVCCGNPLRSVGLEEQAVEQAKKNYRVFSRLKVDAILSLCPTCTHTLKHEYPKLIGKGLDKAMDISVFFLDKLEQVPRFDKTAVYHDPCHLQYMLGVTKEPREIIRKAGIDLIETADPGCCGFGGLYCMSNREMSSRFLAKRGADIMASKSDTVITSCPGCILTLGRSVKDRPVIHLIELIEDAYCIRADAQELLF